MKKSFNLKKEYALSFKYLRNSKNFIYWIIGMFFLFFIMAFFIPTPDFIIDIIMDFIKELLAETEGMSAGKLISFIFLNNLKSSFFGMILGVVLSIFPTMVVIVNGYLLGFVSSLSVADSGLLSLWKIFPHGIFELPAVFISLGLGLKLGTFVLHKKKLKVFKDYLANSVRVFIFIVLPLLIVAAIIEGLLISVMG